MAKRGKNSERSEITVVEPDDQMSTSGHIVYPRARPCNAYLPHGHRSRKLTMEKCQAFYEELTSTPSHNVGSAAMAVGLHPQVVRNAILRYNNDACTSEVDEDVCAILAAAKAEHMRLMRERSDVAGLTGNSAGVAQTKWRCEIEDPTNHPRKLEITGADGAPLLGDGLRGAIEALRRKKAQEEEGG